MPQAICIKTIEESSERHNNTIIKPKAILCNIGRVYNVRKFHIEEHKHGRTVYYRVTDKELTIIRAISEDIFNECFRIIE